MGYTVIAPVGDNIKALFVGMKEFPTERVILVTPKSNLKQAQTTKKKLEEFTIKTTIIQIQTPLFEEMFKAFGTICFEHQCEENPDSIVVNVSTGDKMSSCAALSAAFANGLKAFIVMEDHTMMLPIMKLSYYNELSENKLRILKHMDSVTYASLKELSEKLKMSISLLSYHINGNYKHKGLKEFRLVEIKEEKKSIYVRLSQMGSLLLKGYIKSKDKMCK